MRIRQTVVCAFGLLLCASQVAMALDPIQAAEAFLSKVHDGKASEALDGLYASNPWVAKKPDAVANVKNQLMSAESLIGSLKSWERIQDISVGTRYRYISYLAAYERQPIRYEFQFYRPDKDWITYSFSFDDKLDNNVETRARAEIGKP